MVLITLLAIVKFNDTGIVTFVKVTKIADSPLAFVTNTFGLLSS